MCELMTIAATFVFAVLTLVRARAGQPHKSFQTTAFMFGGAALMWSVDGIASVIEGESFFDLSRDDALLGCLVLAAGLAVFAVLRLRERRLAAA